MSREKIAYLLAWLTLTGNIALYGCGTEQVNTATTTPSNNSTISNEHQSNEIEEKEPVVVEAEVFDWSEPNVEKTDPLFELTEEKVEELTTELHAQIQSVYPGEYPRQNVEGFIYQLNMANSKIFNLKRTGNYDIDNLEKQYGQFINVIDVVVFINASRNFDGLFIDLSKYTNNAELKKAVEDVNRFQIKYLNDNNSNIESADFVYNMFFNLTGTPFYLNENIDINGLYVLATIIGNIGTLDINLRTAELEILQEETEQQYQNYLGTIWKNIYSETNVSYLRNLTRYDYVGQSTYRTSYRDFSIEFNDIVAKDRVYIPVTSLTEPVGFDINKEEDCIDAYRKFNNQFNIFVGSEQDYMNYTTAIFSSYADPKETGSYIQEQGTESIMKSIDAVLLDINNELYYFGSNPTGINLIPDTAAGKLAFDKYKSLFQWAFSEPRAGLPFSLENDTNINPVIYLEWLKRIETMHNMESLAYRPMLTPEQLTQLEGLIESTKRDIASQLESKASNPTAA